jgi:NifU-like protein involved in Fe-S cluster formation
MTAPLYTTEILRLASSLPEPQRLERVDSSAEERSPTCGSRIRLELQLDDQGRVAAINQEVHACAFGQAAAAVMAAAAHGRDREEVAASVAKLSAWLAGEQVDDVWPGLEALEPARSRRGRHGAILLPFRALLSAMERSRS